MPLSIIRLIIVPTMLVFKLIRSHLINFKIFREIPLLLWILYHVLVLGGYGTDEDLAFSFHFFLIQIYYFVIS